MVEAPEEHREHLTKWLRCPALATTHGAAIDNPIGWTHVFMLILFVGWGLFFLYVLFRFRKSRNPVADYNGVTAHASTWLEGAVAVVEAVLLFGFSIPLWAGAGRPFPPENEAMVVRVVGEQFAWNIHYPGPDGVFGRTEIERSTSRRIRWASTGTIPLRRTTSRRSTSSTAGGQAGHRPAQQQGRHPLVRRARVPRQAGRDPGLTIPVWFKPTVTTAQMRERKGNPEFGYEIACAQLCGLGHYRMRGFVTVQTPEEFQKWMDERVAELANPDPFK